MAYGLARKEDFVNLQKLAAATLSIGVLLWASDAAAAEKNRKHTQAPLQVPITGVVAGGGSFAGTLSIAKFAARDGQVVAIGMLRGTVTGAAGAPVGTALVGPTELPVQVSGAAAARSSAAASGVVIQQTCELLHLEIQPITLDVLGLQVTTLPIGIDLVASGEGTDVLGRLICTVLETVGNVIGLVDLLNQILGLLTGLLGALIPG